MAIVKDMDMYLIYQLILSFCLFEIACSSSSSSSQQHLLFLSFSFSFLLEGQPTKIWLLSSLLEIPTLMSNVCFPFIFTCYTFHFSFQYISINQSISVFCLLACMISNYDCYYFFKNKLNININIFLLKYLHTNIFF